MDAIISPELGILGKIYREIFRFFIGHRELISIQIKECDEYG